MSTASSFLVVGFFGLASGHRVASERANNTRLWHAYYVSTIQCPEPPFLSTQLRIYSPINDPILPDNTVAHVVGKLHIPPPDAADSSALIDAIHLTPCPVDPTTDNYED